MGNFKDEFYKCYSQRLKNFLAVNDIKPLTVGYNMETKKRYWTYLITERLEELLTTYSKTFYKEKI